MMIEIISDGFEYMRNFKAQVDSQKQGRVEIVKIDGKYEEKL